MTEVLSDTTEAFDRGDKFRDYRTLESLDEYILNSQKLFSVDIFSRNASGQWVLTTYETDDRISLKSVGISFDVAELYEDVEFDRESSG